jgi:hypothetical protein
MYLFRNRSTLFTGPSTKKTGDYCLGHSLQFLTLLPLLLPHECLLAYNQPNLIRKDECSWSALTEQRVDHGRR